MKKLLALTALILPIAMTEAKSDLDPENTLLIDLKDGQLVIQMYPEDAPGHVKRIKELARAGKYDGVAFHRVIEGFMAQTGDVQFGNVKKFNEGRVGTGGSDKPDLDAEFSDEPHVRGTLSMARTNDPNSANSQFFIVFEGASHLNGQYTVWGQVTEGMEHVDKIKRGGGRNGMVDDPDKIVTMRVAADVDE